MARQVSHPPTSHGDGPKCYFFSRLEPMYHPLLSPLITVTKYLQSFLTYTQIEKSETVFYQNVYNNLKFFFRTFHFSCRMLVENAKYQDRIKVPEDLIRIQAVTHELHNLLTRLVELLVEVEKKAMEYEKRQTPRKLLGPNFNYEEVTGQAQIFACRVIVEEALNILHELVKVLSETPAVKL
ncbi:hypothetical protein EV426DRAFT_639143 [Tirmania nivea]|nr:hypothetical protein EV426DRAFT_639143 [Tirmania nivea]